MPTPAHTASGRLKIFLAGPAFPALPLLLAAAGAALLHTRYYVGFFNDDASFVLLAGGLWERLAGLEPGGLAGAFSHFLPGYPVFLAPFAAALAPHWGWLRWTTAGLALLSVWGLWRLLAGWLSEEERRWAVFLYAAHPLFLLSSGIVMADPFLACLFIYGLLGLRLVLERPGPWAYALLLGASAWAAAAKPIGLLLPAAVTAALLAARAGKALRAMALAVWLPLLAAALWSAARNETPTDYVGYMLKGLASLADQSLWQRGYGLLHAFGLVYGLALPWPRGLLADAAGAALAAGAIALCLKGLAALLSREGPGRAAAVAAGLLLLGQGLVMSLWTVYSERYALPMLPLWLPLLVVGAGTALKARPAAARALLCVLALWFCAHAAYLAAETRSARRPEESRFCGRTLEWIRTETPEGSRFSGNAVLVRLYARRQGWGLFAAPDFDSFLLNLSSLGITHALITAQPVLSTGGPYRNNHAWQQAMERGWIRRHPGVFTRVYANVEEKTEIYSVTLPPGLVPAAEVYGRALAALRGEDPARARALLRLALKEYPGFVSALTALAALEAWPEAGNLARRALALEPNHPPAAALLAELLERRGRGEEARKVRAGAQAALSLPPFRAEP